MKKTALLLLALAFPAGAYAADLNGLRAADVASGFSGELPAPVFSVVRTSPARATGFSALVRAACAAVGEDVRIPEECCSKKAEPNQNGEMTCVAASPALPVTPVNPSVPACAAVGDDVRIPEECCSRNAEPNQNGEMTCVAAKAAASPFARR